MSSRLGPLTFAIITAMSASSALAQGAVYHKVVNRGQNVSLGFYASVNPDCTSRGYATVAVLSSPQGGQVLSSHGSDFATFVAANPRAACNKRRLQGTKVWYKANSSFLGTDSFPLQIVTANGDVSNFNMLIEVR